VPSLLATNRSSGWVQRLKLGGHREGQVMAEMSQWSLTVAERPIPVVGSEAKLSFTKPALRP